MNKYPGTLIVFEGIDGCGKTSVIEEVFKQLVKEGKKVVMLANIVEGSTTGTAIRTMLSTPGDTIDDIRIINLYLSELRYAVYNKENGIIEYLKEDYIVLCSRWFYSTYAYIKQNEVINNIIFHSTVELPEPDLALYLKVETGTAVERIKARNTNNSVDYFEKRDKLEAIKTRYDTLFSNKPFGCSTIKIVTHGITINNNSNFEYNTKMIKDLVTSVSVLKNKKNTTQQGETNE